MTKLQQQVSKAKHKLWLNRWLNCFCWTLTGAAVAFAAVVLVQRLYDAALPLTQIGVVFGALGLLASVIWTMAGREDEAAAAARLDDAAGLRERISTGLYCEDSKDPFARAVVTDAERASSSVSVRAHLPLLVPRPLSYASVSVVLAALMFLITPGLLKSEVQQGVEQDVQLQQTQALVKKNLDDARKIVATNPALKDMKDEFDFLSKDPIGKLTKPEDLRHNAAKDIDKLADAIKQKRKESKYESVNEMRKMMRGLKVPKDNQAPTQKLAKSLAQGDFKTAREEMNKLREQLASLKSDEDKKLVEQLSKQLDDIAKQIEKATENKDLEKKLEQAGVKKEDVERMLQNLKKKDLNQLRKQLEKSGMSKQQIEKTVKQLQKRQQAGNMAKQLAKSMKQAAQCNNPGQMGEAIGGMSSAAEQLSNLEQLEQEMAQLDSALAQVQDIQDGMGQPCSGCNGSGKQGSGQCSQCNGSGQRPGPGMSTKQGQGRGGLAPEEKATVGFKMERSKVYTTKGAIIGQFLVDGEQIKGEVNSKAVQIFTAAERDATDAVNRDRMPRQYQQAVREYFAKVKRTVEGNKSGSEPAKVPPPAPKGGNDNP